MNAYKIIQNIIHDLTQIMECTISMVHILPNVLYIQAKPVQLCARPNQVQHGCMVSIFAAWSYQLYYKTLWCRVQLSKISHKNMHATDYLEYIKEIKAFKFLSKTRDN